MTEPGRLQSFGLAHWRSAAQSMPLPDSLPGYLLGYLAGFTTVRPLGKWL